MHTFCVLLCTVGCILSIFEITDLRDEIDLKSSQIEVLKKENEECSIAAQKLIERFSRVDTARIKVTGYSPYSGGINSDSNPNMTATMTPHKSGYTCAISAQLVEFGWLGKEIYIEGFGIVLANDRLAKGLSGMQIDLCKGSYKDAMEVGVNKDVLATLVSRKYINYKLKEN